MSQATLAGAVTEPGSLLAGAEPIDWRHQQQFDEALQRHQPQVSELTFSNLLVWRDTYPRRCFFVDGHLVCGYTTDGIHRLLQPIGPDPARIIRQLSTSSAIRWHRVDSAIAEQVSGELEVQQDLDESDYVYRRDDLVALQGSGYAKIRGHRNYFLRENTPETRPLTSENVNDARAINELWLKRKLERGINDRHTRRDAEVAVEMLDAFDRLPRLLGTMIYIDNQPIAFALGERLSDDTVVCHFEKCDLDLRGLAHHTFVEWAEALPDWCVFVNRMQAQGEPGLEKWKQAWRPSHRVTKCVVSSSNQQ